MFRNVLKGCVLLAAIAMLGLSWGSQVFAEEEVTASKINLRDYFPTAYSVLNLRHYSEMVDGENPTPFMQLRAYLGAKWLDEKLDTYLTLGLNKVYETDEFSSNRTVSQRTPEIYAIYSLVDTAMLDLSPRVGVIMPLGSSQVALELGAELASSSSMDTAAGKISFGGVADVYALQHIGSNDTNVSIADEARREHLRETYSLTTTDDGDLSIKEDYARYASKYGIWAKYEPDMIDGLALAVGTAYELSYIPAWEAAGEGEDAVIQKSGYRSSDRVENTFSLSYEITDALSISNSLYYYVDGFYEGKTAPGDTRLLNLAKISYNLF